MLIFEAIGLVVELIVGLVVLLVEMFVTLIGVLAEALFFLAVSLVCVIASPVIWLWERIPGRLTLWPPSLRTLMRFINALQVVAGLIGLPPAAYLCYFMWGFPGAQAAGIGLGLLSVLLACYAVYVFYQHFADEAQGRKRL